MRNKCPKISAICLLMVLLLLPANIAMASAHQKPDFSHENVEINFKGGREDSLRWYFNYDDNFFSNSSYIYDHDLAKISLALALASSPPVSSQIYFGEEGDNFGREQNIKEAYDKLGFTNDKFYAYDKSLNKPDTKAALSMAQKRIEIDGESFNLIVVVPMSHGYGVEWEKNFLLGSNETFHHQGFDEASKKVQEYIHDYLQNSYINTGDKIKLWMVGYSRGANIVNIAAADLDKAFDSDPLFVDLKIERENFYAYTFGCSRGVVVEGNPDFQEENVHIFKNIFNIINPADILTILPPSQWGVGRYGVDMFLQVEETSNYSPDYDLIESTYRGFSGGTYSAHDLPALILILKDFEEIFSVMVPDSQFYVENLQAIVSEFVVIVNSAVPDEDNPGEWIQDNLKDNFLQRYGKVGQKAYLRSDIYFTLLISKIHPKLGLIRIPLKDMYPTIMTVVALLDLNKVKFNLSAHELIDIAVELLKVHDVSLFSSLAQSHYPESYISWLFSADDPSELYIQTKLKSD